MRAAGFRGVGLAATVMLAGFLPLPSRAQEPKYLDILVPPVLGDQIGGANAVTVDGESGEIFVCDGRNGRILIFDRDLLFRFEIMGGEVFSAPKDLAVDRDGFLYVLTPATRLRGGILKLDFDGQKLGELTLSGLPEELPPPMLVSLAITPDGQRLFLLDQGNLVLWFADRSGRILDWVDVAEGLSASERQDLILGQVDLYGDKLLVALPSVSEIRCFDLTRASCGVTGSRGGGQCGLLFPTAAALDATGHYLIVDQQRMFILRWDPRTNKCLGEYYGLGDAPGYLYYPYDVFLDTEGRLYVAQLFKGKVQVYGDLAPAAGSSAD